MFKLKARMTKNRFSHLKPAVRRQIVKVVNETTEEVFDVSQQLVPVDTGELKASGEVETYGAGELRRVAYSAEHAVPVEYGTHDSEAQPYLRPAIELVKSRLNRRLGQIEAGLSKEIGK